MESGQTKIASFMIGLRIAKELGTDPWYLATGESDEAATEARLVSGDQLALRVRALERQISFLVTPRTGASTER